VKLTKRGGKRVTRYVHTLVLAAFVCPRPPGYDIDHVNGIRSDNRLVNLEYVSTSENVRRSWARIKADRSVNSGTG
jgi:hypothetical protein